MIAPDRIQHSRTRQAPGRSAKPSRPRLAGGASLLMSIPTERHEGDPTSTTRLAAAGAFDLLHTLFGPVTVTSVVREDRLEKSDFRLSDAVVQAVLDDAGETSGSERA